MWFEKAVQGQPIKAYGYRWESFWYPYLTMQAIRDRESWGVHQMYVCDCPDAWHSPWVKGQRLYLIHFDIKNPLVVHDSMTLYEKDFSDKVIANIIRQGYDAIIYTPHHTKDGWSVRQALLLDPINQVIEVELLQGEHYVALPDGAQWHEWGD